MITRTGRTWPIGGIPPIDEAGQLVGLAGGRPPDIALAGDRGQAGEIDPVRSGHEAQDRLERSVVARRDEDERLDDLAELGADCGGGFGRVGRLVEDRDLERDALARCGVQDPLDPGVVRSLGHGRSLASVATWTSMRVLPSPERSHTDLRIRSLTCSTAP